MLALFSGASGMLAQEQKINTVSNNLANVNTTGFKMNRAEFADLMYQTHLVAGATVPGGGQIPAGIQIGMGVKALSMTKDFEQGSIIDGGRWDMAVMGDGFFKILKNGEEYYTRDGNFVLQPDGTLTTPQGDPLQPPITINNAEKVTAVAVRRGVLQVYQDANIVQEEDLRLYRFVNPKGLYATGQNLLAPTEGSGPAVEGVPEEGGFGTIVSGSLESSNVDVATEFVNMIIGQRAYEANSKSIQTADSMLGIANSVKR